MLGAALMRSQGRAAWLRFNAALAEGRVPGREVMDGALVIFGGALLLTPGFLVGLPRADPAAAADARDRAPRARRALRPRARRDRGERRAGADVRLRRAGRGAGATPRYDDVVDSSATEVDPRRTELP